MKDCDKSQVGISFPTPPSCHWSSAFPFHSNISSYFLLIPLLLSAISFPCAAISSTSISQPHLASSRAAVATYNGSHPSNAKKPKNKTCLMKTDFSAILGLPRYATFDIRVNGYTSYVYLATGTRTSTLLLHTVMLKNR